MELELTIEVFREGGVCVAYTPELDVSSCGETPERAEAMLREAIGLVLEDAKEHGDLDELLANAGLELTSDGKLRRAPERTFARIKIAVPA